MGHVSSSGELVDFWPQAYYRLLFAPWYPPQGVTISNQLIMAYEFTGQLVTCIKGLSFLPIESWQVQYNRQLNRLWQTFRNPWFLNWVVRVIVLLFCYTLMFYSIHPPRYCVIFLCFVSRVNSRNSKHCK